MQNISSNLSTKELDLPEVEVLLATFNGEKYLDELLDSLTKQVGVEIKLVVSDDGSTDSTQMILSKYKKKFKSFTILEGPRLGPSANFFFLLQHANGDYVALADQDDVWISNHLHDSISRIQNFDTPTLSFSSLIEFSGVDSSGKQWPRHTVNLEDFRSFIFENPSRGCTQVFNKKLLNLAKTTPKNMSLMHDWWLLNLAALIGNIAYSPRAGIRYRKHENNFTFHKKSALTWSKLFRIKEHIFVSICQWWEIFSNSHDLHTNGKEFQSDFTRSFLVLAYKVIFTWPKLRMNLLENIILKVSVIKHRKLIANILFVKDIGANQ